MGREDMGRMRAAKWRGVGLWVRYLIPALAVAGVGIGLAGAPLTAGLVLAGCTFVLLSVLLIRAAMGWHANVYLTTAPKVSGGHGEGTANGEPPLRVARGLYYAGVISIGLLTVRPLVTLTLSDLFFLFALLAAGLEILATRQFHHGQLPRGVVLGVVTFALGGAISSIGAHLPGESIRIVARMVYITLVWFWLGTVVLRTSGQVQIAIRCWVVSAAATAGAGVVQLLFGNVIPGGSIDGGRVTGFTGQVNELGGVTSIALLLSLIHI